MIKERVNTENNQGPGVFVIGFLQPCERLFSFAQGSMDNGEIVSRNIAKLCTLLQIVKYGLSLRGVSCPCTGVRELRQADDGVRRPRTLWFRDGLRELSHLCVDAAQPEMRAGIVRIE